MAVWHRPERTPGASSAAANIPLRGLLRLFAGASLRRPGRLSLSILAIALGVALGVAVGAIHRSALAEFSRGLSTVSGGAELQVSGPREGFAEQLYPVLARHPAVAWASPVVEIEARLAGSQSFGGRPGSDATLRLIGLDPLRAWRVQPGLVPGPTRTGGRRDFGLLEADTIALSAAAAGALGARPGDHLNFVAGSDVVQLRVSAVLPAVGRGQRLAVADIATVQERFRRLGRLTRIDLVVAPGLDREQARRALAALLPPGVSIVSAAQAEERAERLSRAYRINLNLLALIALVTGGFLVFSTQAASIVQRRAELGFLRALGLTGGELMAGLLLEAATVGLVGSLLGVAFGAGLAGLILEVVGGDLGAGYFESGHPQLSIDPWSLLRHALLGMAAALAGAWLPAREAATAEPARSLKAGDDERALAGLDHTRLALACLALGGLALGIPGIDGLPLGGYAAIALWLAGSVLLLPRLARLFFRLLPQGRPPPLRLALAQLRAAPGLASIGAGGILAATAVAAAMAIMVASFRDSVDRWLHQVLPADLYVRASRAGESGFLDPPLQQAIAALPGVERAAFSRHDTLVLDPALPPVALIGRPLGAEPAAIVGEQAVLPKGVPALWASEAIADLYGWRAGQAVSLPLGGASRRFVVAGFWRDYARSFGALVIDLGVYRDFTGDLLADDVAIDLADGARRDDILRRLRTLPGGERLDVSDAGEIRSLSLAIFDRTFAVTYGLEAAAVLIGLAGVAASFAALAAGRLREFGMLSHIGLTRGELRTVIAAEGMAVAGLGIGIGIALAFAIALVLIHVVNRQSFHWSMDLAVPWTALLAFAAAMFACGVAAALTAARRALGPAAARAVREDW